MRSAWTGWCAIAVGACAMTAARPAQAEDHPLSDLSESVEDYLQSADRWLEENRVWRIRMRPHLRENFIWTDNVYLNDKHEDNVRLLSFERVSEVRDSGGNVVTTAVRTINDPDRLRFVEQTSPDLRDSSTKGRVDDLIFQTELGLDFTLPVNTEENSRFFKAEELTLLGVNVRNQEYVDENELDNTSVFLNSDVFGFLDDIFDFEAGRNFWVRMRHDYSEVKDPLDTSIRELRSDSLRRVQDFADFEREEYTLNLDAGWKGERTDAAVGFEYYNLDLNDRELRQAEHWRQNWHVELGTQIPGIAEKRFFTRWDYWQYHFGRKDFERRNTRDVVLTGAVGAQHERIHGTRVVRVPVVTPGGDPVVESVSEQILNDAEVHRWVVGVEGLFFSRKVSGRAEAGYMVWDPQKDGLAAREAAKPSEVAAIPGSPPAVPPGVVNPGTGVRRPPSPEAVDNPEGDHFSGFTGLLQVAYQPWEGRNTRFQFQYERGLSFSSISNYNATHSASFTILHEIIEKRLDSDFTLSYTRTEPENGPKRDLYEAGVGLVYHVTKNLDFTARYMVSMQESSDEIATQSSFVKRRTPQPGPLPGGTTTITRRFDVLVKSDGDFLQNVFLVGFDLHF